MEHELDVAVVAVVAASALVWSLVAARLERINISAPMAFVVFGLVSTHGPLSVIEIRVDSSTARSVAEITLALVLFVDASRVNVRALRHDAALPARLLGVGLPLTIGAGFVAGVALYRGTGLWVVAAIAAAIAPTDAALGAAIMQDSRVPGRIRRVLNVESGLNDGIATPFVGIFLAGAAASEDVHGAGGVGAAAVDLLGGAGTGIGIGLVAAVLMRFAAARGYSAAAFRPLTPLAVALVAYAGTVQVGANGFIAAFVAGMAFGSLLPPDLEPTIEFTNVVGEVLSLLMWFLVGAAMLVPAVQSAKWQDVVFAVLALTVVRMVPVAIACAGLGLDRRTVAFIGWFGPRGLASVIFALLAFDTLRAADGSRMLAAVTITVVLSVVAHGITASPFAARYGAAVAEFHPHGPEHVPAPELAPRSLPGRARVGRRPEPRSEGRGNATG
jgi:NhaP-type Na+/H+ or K+/H+ antiporter